MIPSRCLDGSISVSGYSCVNDNKNALFVLYNNVTSIVKYFSVISVPLDLWLHEVQFQLVPKFSQVFFVSTHLGVFAKHLINFCPVHHFLAKLANFEKSPFVKIASFFHLIWILYKPFMNSSQSFDKPFINSCQTRYFRQIWNVCKNSQQSTCLLCHLSRIYAKLQWIVAKFATFVIIAICRDSPFCHPVLTFLQPLIPSCQIRHFRKTGHLPKNRQLSTCLFVSSNLNIWPNLWWILACSLFLPKFSFFRLNFIFYYNRYL